jgi:hypothetical protein
MAVTNRTGTAISNATANPSVANTPPRSAGRLVRVQEQISSMAADNEATAVLRFFRVKSSDVVASVQISCADATTAGALNVGLYDTSENGSAVVDADLFASAFALTNGPYSNTDITFESGEYTFAEAMKPLWEVLGLSSDPCKDYDVCAVISTTFNGGPTSILLAAELIRP